MSVLSYALVSTPASPLRKALIDSGLGEDVTGGGLSTNLRQMTFGVGMKGIVPADAEKVEALIEDTLAQLVQHGIDSDMVEAAYNTIEFSLRENNTGSYPRGLSIMLRALRMWGYGRDPLAAIAFEEPLAVVRRRLDDGDGYLRHMMRVYLLENRHRATVVLTPDPELNQRREAKERSQLDYARAAMSPQELQSMVDATRELREIQARPDSPEDLAKLPTLSLSDLDKEIRTIPIEVMEDHGSQILYHDLFTNGIVYLNLGFNLHAVSPELLFYAKLFGQSLVELGTETEDFVRLSQRIGRKTGGIYSSTFLSAKRNESEGAAQLFLHGKSTLAQAQDMLDIMCDVLRTGKAGQPGTVPADRSGSQGACRVNPYTCRSYCGRSAAALCIQCNRLGPANRWAALNISTACASCPKQWRRTGPGVLAKLERVREQLINRTGMIVNVTLDAENWVAFAPQLGAFLAELPAAPPVHFSWSPELNTLNEGLAIPAQVNYVGKGANLYALGYQLHGSVNVITNLLRTGYLWDKVRVQGGAYGGFCRFDRHSGVLSFLSYRDPNLRDTIDVYDAAAHYLRNLELNDDELTKSIIGAVGALDAYQLPDAKGYTSMVRHLLGMTDDERQRNRDEVLGSSIADFRAFADLLDAVAQSGRVVVLGGRDALDEANRARPDWLTVQRVL